MLCLNAGEPPLGRSRKELRPDISFETFEGNSYNGWSATGTAFGPGPVEKSKMAAYQGDPGSEGLRLVNTHNVRQGEDVRAADAHVGTLTSKAFTIERDFITFLIGGGDQRKTCLNCSSTPGGGQRPRS